MRKALSLSILLTAAVLVSACDARRDYPPGYTDVGLWQGESIRPDTEVPNQYPNGTTRGALMLDPHEDEGSGSH